MNEGFKSLECSVVRITDDLSQTGQQWRPTCTHLAVDKHIGLLGCDEISNFECCLDNVLDVGHPVSFHEFLCEIIFQVLPLHLFQCELAHLNIGVLDCLVI